MLRGTLYSHDDKRIKNVDQVDCTHNNVYACMFVPTFPANVSANFFSGEIKFVYQNL